MKESINELCQVYEKKEALKKGDKEKIKQFRFTPLACYVYGEGDLKHIIK